MSRFYVSPEDVKGDKIYVKGDEVHHILDVMRLREGDEVVAFDGLGNEYTGIITDIRRKSAVISIQKRQKKPPLNAKIALAQAIPKSEKMDHIIQKCTELGVQSIIPMITERTVVKALNNAEVRRHIRWLRIAKEAAKQCGRSDMPEIKNISGFKETLELSKAYSLRIMPELFGNRKNLANLVSDYKKDSAIVFIGPEGGFSPAEVNLAERYDFNLISLGQYTLRSDTAAIAAVAILRYLLRGH